MFRTILAATFLALAPTGTLALDGLVKCPEGNEALPRVTETSYGVPLDKTFAINIGERSLMVPIGYLSPWPPQQFYENQPFDGRKGFQFSFWMPDGRMSEVDTYFNVMRRPCEPGRAQATEDVYIVNVIYRPLSGPGPHDGDRFDDESARKSLKSGFPADSRMKITPHGEMVEYRPSHYQVYLLLSSAAASFDAVVKCFNMETQLPNMACLGDIRFHGDDYALHFRIPRDSVYGFEPAAKLARRLVHSWTATATDR